MKMFSAARLTGCALACFMLLSTTAANADPLHKSKHRHVVAHKHRVVPKVVVARPTPIRTITTVSAFSLNSLPVGYVRFLHEGDTYYYSNGVYYERRPHGYVIVKPKIGFRVAALPSGYRIIREGNATFYSFNNVRYRKLDGVFVVV